MYGIVAYALVFFTDEDCYSVVPLSRLMYVDAETLKKDDVVSVTGSAIRQFIYYQVW